MYMLFMGPPELDCEWQDNGLEGIKRFSAKIWTFITTAENTIEDGKQDLKTRQRIHKFLQVFQERLKLYKPNTALAAFMELFNDLIASRAQVSKADAKNIVICYSIFAPHMASELLELVFATKLRDCQWPTFDPTLVVENQVTIVVQINGKMRSNLLIDRDISQEIVQQLAQEKVAQWLKDKVIKKVIFVPNRLISFVIE
jgi:leucyl-tRNA synthetase